MMPTGAMNAALAGASQLTSLATDAVVHGLSPEGQAEDRQRKEDIERLKRNNFGPSKAEQERMVGDAMAQVRAQSQGALAENARAKAAQGFRAPDNTTAQIVKNQGGQAGQLRLQASDAAAKLAVQAKDAAFARVKAAADKTSADVRSIRDEGHKAYMGSEGGSSGEMGGKDGAGAYGITGKTANKNAYGGV